MAIATHPPGEAGVEWESLIKNYILKLKSKHFPVSLLLSEPRWGERIGKKCGIHRNNDDVIMTIVI